jgi:hypothetical protein
LGGEAFLNNIRCRFLYVKPRDIGVCRVDYSALVHQFLSNRGEDVRIDALIEWAGIADFLLQGPCDGYTVMRQDAHKALPGDLFPFVTAQLSYSVSWH